MDNIAELIYRRYFTAITLAEVQQEVELAKLKVGTDNPGHVYTVAKNAVIDQVRRSMVWVGRTTPLDLAREQHDNTDFLRKLQREEEWELFLASLPYYSRMLASVAEQEATNMSLRGVEVWRRKSMMVLRENIRDRYEDWRDRTHPRPPRYRKAREDLQHHLRVHWGACGYRNITSKRW